MPKPLASAGMDWLLTHNMHRKVLLILGAVFLVAIIGFPLVSPANPVPPSAPIAQQTAVPTVASTPTSAATATPLTFASGSAIAGVEVAGLTKEAALAKVQSALGQMQRPLTMEAGPLRLTLATADLLTLPAAEVLLAQAVPQSSPVSLPLQTQVDRQALRARLERLLPSVEQPMINSLVSDEKAITQTFTFVAQPGIKIDLDQAVDVVAEALSNPAATSLRLPTTVVTPTRQPIAELGNVLIEHATYWKGVAGFYVHDLETGESIGYNADTVFSGASVMKVPIMIFAYARLGTLNEQQREWLRLVINESKNIEANNLLAAAVGGSGTEDALEGVNQMSAMLAELGLKRTYMIIPYESGQYLIQISKLPRGGPPREGPAPFTAADPYLRTTPSEMGRLFVMLAECSTGTGLLIEKFSPQLNQKVCQEMIRWLESPHDQERMVAGIPAGVPVAHKGGWTDDFQGDVGIVHSPNGRYVAAIYIYRDGLVTNYNADPSPYLGDFSHTIYSFFNPESPKTARQGAKEAE